MYDTRTWMIKDSDDNVCAPYECETGTWSINKSDHQVRVPYTSPELKGLIITMA